MSKSSFKKALGNLYKKGEVELLDDKTILKRTI
jgi:predicted RNA-binding protein (virulence factor B family)